MYQDPESTGVEETVTVLERRLIKMGPLVSRRSQK